MTELGIDGLQLRFDDSWLVTKWDDSPWYRTGIEGLKGEVDRRPEGTKAVDVVGIREEIPYLFEIKDFRGFAIENKARQVRELPVEIGLKARDTIAGLVGVVSRGREGELPPGDLSPLGRRRARGGDRRRPPPERRDACRSRAPPRRHRRYHRRHPGAFAKASVSTMMACPRAARSASS